MTASVYRRGDTPAAADALKTYYLRPTTRTTMADLLGSEPEVEDTPAGDPRVVTVDGEAADEVLSALSADTARRILAQLHERPGPASDLADRVDTTLQNAQHHLGTLHDAGLIEVADTTYSEKGREMDVYAPADRALVVVAGRESETQGLVGAVKRLLGGLVPVALAAVAAEVLLDGPFAPSFAAQSGGADGGETAVTTSADVASETVARGAADPGLLAQLGQSPGALLFAGGLLAVVASLAVVAVARRRE
ncbi:ArsR/SmtB family transcription factor [Halobaculum sp. MBLA0147]|uniref:ArsR/SmtB family transcription factor n=1 Tax=Halobaculum sp. MBLA0147 TaxID=3079934 RepID=UPI0035257899